MKASFDYKLIVILLVLFFCAAFSINISFAEENNSISNKIENAESISEDLEVSFLIEKLNKKIEDFEELVDELERRKKILKKLERVQKYIEMDITSDLDKVESIAKETPLDEETAAIVVSYAEKLDIKPSLILAVIKLESNFNKYEVGDHQDRGYMQIIPSTEKWLANKYGKKLDLEYNPKKIFEPEYNIGLGTIYLSILKEAYGNNYSRILSEYNRGPYNLKKYFNKHKTYVTNYSRGVLKREKIFLRYNE